MTQIKTADEVMGEALATATDKLLEECTVKQLSFFNQLFPGRLHNYSAGELTRAYNLVVRTVKKNREQT